MAFFDYEPRRCIYDARRALSSGRLTASIIAADGAIVPVPQHYWNAEDAWGVLYEGRPALFGEHGGCAIIKLDEYVRWLKDRHQSEPVDPVAATTEWLSNLMAQFPQRQPKAKAKLREEARDRFGVTVTDRQFDEAWRIALSQNSGCQWSRPGAIPKQSSQNPIKIDSQSPH